jgi:hypothetical protein
MEASDFDGSKVKDSTLKQLEWASRPPPPVELPQGIDKDTPKGKILTSIEELGQKANKDLGQVNEFFPDSAPGKATLKKPAEEVVSGCTKWENYLAHQEEIEIKLTQLQEQYEAAKRGSKAFDNVSGVSNPQGADEARTDALYDEVLNFQMANIPSEMFGLYKISPEIQDKPLAQEYLKQVEDWKKFAQSERERIKKEKDKEKAPDSVKAELEQLRQEAQAQKERADLAEAAQKAAEARAQAAENAAQQLREQHMQEMQAKNDQIAGLQQKIDEATAETARARKFENPPRTEEEWAEMPAWIKEIYERDAQQRARIIELEDQIEATQRPSLADRLRTIGGLMFGAGTTEAAALAVLAARPELGPVSYLLGSMTATSAWMLAEVGSMRRGLEVEHPRLARFIRDSMNGSILTTIANTAVSALEATGVTHLLHNAPETAQQAAQTYTTQGPQWTAEFAHTAAREAGKATAPIKTAVETLHTVASGENLSTIVRDTLLLTNYQEIYRHTVETILGNLDKLPADKASLISNLTTEQVMKDQELFKKVMDAGRIIHPGQTFAIK